MGDNIYLGDRDGVRTPMQWTPDRNAGFSKADFARLYLPPLMDPVYGYQAVNVEAQQRNPSSFLHWMQRMLEVRKQHPVFGIGSLRGAVAPRTRRCSPSCASCVDAETGTTRHRAVRQQPLPVRPARRAAPRPPTPAWCPHELLGRVPFPPIGELPYFVTLPPYGFYWFELEDS